MSAKEDSSVLGGQCQPWIIGSAGVFKHAQRAPTRRIKANAGPPISVSSVQPAKRYQIMKVLKHILIYPQV